MSIESFANKVDTGMSDKVKMPDFDKRVDKTNVGDTKADIKQEKFNPDDRKNIDIDKKIETQNDNKSLIDGQDKIPDKNDLSYEQKIEKQDVAISQYEKEHPVPMTASELNSGECGNYGEMKADQDLRSMGYKRISKDVVTDVNDKTHQGLDGVYYKKDGEPPFLIVETKFNTAKRHETQDGIQGCKEYNNNRLDAAVGKKMADEIRKESFKNNVFSLEARVSLKSDVSYIKLDQSGKAERGWP